MPVSHEDHGGQKSAGWYIWNTERKELSAKDSVFGKNKGGIKTFLDKWNLKEFIARLARLVPQEMLKRVLQPETKEH